MGLPGYDAWKTETPEDELARLMGKSVEQLEQEQQIEEEEYATYQLQCAFEDLCSVAGYDTARRRAQQLIAEHFQMLKRQGKI